MSIKSSVLFYIRNNNPLVCVGLRYIHALLTTSIEGLVHSGVKGKLLVGYRTFFYLLVKVINKVELNAKFVSCFFVFVFVIVDNTS